MDKTVSQNDACADTLDAPRYIETQLPGLLESGAFIEVHRRSNAPHGAPQYRLYSHDMGVIQAIQRLGLANGRLPPHNLFQSGGDGPASGCYFGTKVTEEFVKALGGKLPVIDTQGKSPTASNELIKSELRAYANEQRVNGFLGQEREVCDFIRQHGVVIRPNPQSSANATLLLPVDEALDERGKTLSQRAHVALHKFADTLGNVSIDTNHPYYESAGMVLESGSLLDLLAEKLAPKDRIYPRFIGQEMAGVAQVRPAAQPLKSAVEEVSGLPELLESQAYFLSASNALSSQNKPPMMLFADEEVAQQCLSLLTQVPGFEKATLGDPKSRPHTKFAKIDLTACDWEQCRLLSGFAGAALQTTAIGTQKWHERRSVNMRFLENLIREEHPCSRGADETLLERPSVKRGR